MVVGWAVVILDVAVGVAAVLLVAEASNLASKGALRGVKLSRSDSAQAIETAHSKPVKKDVITVTSPDVAEVGVVTTVEHTFVESPQSRLAIGIPLLYAAVG